MQKELLQNDTFHGKYAKKSKKLGYIQLWAWANCYLFLDITGKCSTIKLEDIGKFTIISNDEFYSEYLPLNKPKDLFLTDGSFIGDKTAYTERQQMYGLYHDLFNTILTEKRTNGIWSGSFCRAIASIATEYNFSAEIIKRWGSITEARKDYDNFVILFNNYYYGKDCFFEKKIDETGLLGVGKEVILTEDKIISYLKKVKSLPEIYQKEIMKNYKTNKEIKYYLDKFKGYL
jgi:hypothetical protein